jgi:hypothetical protein
VINLTISIEEAFKVLLSGGIVGPNLASAVPPDRIPSVTVQPLNALEPDNAMMTPISLAEGSPTLIETEPGVEQLSVLPLDEA